MAKYNGHKNWNHWNVFMWINNDEGLYRLAMEQVEGCRTRERAAENIVHELASAGITCTPDGAPYSKSAVRAALVGM